MISTGINMGYIRQTGQLPGSLKLIQSVMPLRVLDMKSTVNEAAGGGRPVLKITGVFQKADDENQNGRVYPYSVVSEAVKSIQEDVTSRAIMGEFDHPADAKIHLANVSHLITKVWMEGKYVYGVAEVLEDMPCGKMLATLLRNKVQIGISSRGVGDMEVVNEGAGEKFLVQPGYQFVTWDIVGEPSVKEAVMHVMENKNRLRGSGLMTRATRQLDPKKALVAEINNWLRGK